MSLSRLTATLLNRGTEVLDRTSGNALRDLAVFVNGMNPDSYFSNDQFVFLRSALAIDKPELFEEGAVARQFRERLTKSELFSDIDYAFTQPNVVRLCTHSGALLEHQISLIDRVTTAAAEHAGVMMLLGLAKSSLRGHYYHGLRAGVEVCSMFEVFDPYSELPIATRLLAGILHDVGKLRVPEDILFKPEKLNKEENAIMTAHDAATEEILKPFDMWFPHLSQIAANHHLTSQVETSGNPHVERAGVLMRMADVYDALGSERDYKKAWAVQRVASTLHCYFPNNPAEIIYLLSAFPCPVRR